MATLLMVDKVLDASYRWHNNAERDTNNLCCVITGTDTEVPETNN